MSSDIYEKSWVELCEEDEEDELDQSDRDDVEMERVSKEQEEAILAEDIGDSINFCQSGTADKDIKEEPLASEKSKCSSTSTHRNIKDETENMISKYIIEEKEIKVNDELLSKYIKQGNVECNDDIDDMCLFMNQTLEEELEKKKVAEAIEQVETKVKTKVTIEGAEDAWAAFVEPTEQAPKRPTFAEICAKNASPAPVVQVNVQNAMVSPTKKQRKRSLFPEDSCGSKAEIFGILDENSVDSPSKDIRKIMNNIHMDSPLRSDSENIDSVTTRKKAVAIRRDLSGETSKPMLLRKRTRDPTKSNESPAPKIAHYSDSPKEKKKDNKDSPARKNKGIETDKTTLIRRQKQIDYGKNTKGYDNYIKMVPKDKREAFHPKTPPRHLLYSRRAWDGLIKVWRQKLHFWDSPADGGKGGIGLPDSWDSLSEGSSVITSDEMSERSLPTTPQADRKRKGSVDNSGD